MIKSAKAQIWTKDKIESTGFPEDEYDSIQKKKNVGICISGGGTVSISAGIGYLRGLHQLGLLSNVRYLSGVSGGSWIGVPYTFLPPGRNIETLLGAELLDDPDASHLTRDKLTKLNHQSLNYQITKADAVRDALNLMIDKVPTSEAFSEALGEIFLGPNGLYDRNYKKYFTLNRKSLKKILDNNPDLDENQFYLAAEDRPFLIANATMVYPISGYQIQFTLHREFPWIKCNLKLSPNSLHHFEYTPLYTGCFSEYTNVQPGEIDLGGGYLESFGFNSVKASPIEKDLMQIEYDDKSTVFKLCDVMGSSGAAPAAFIENIDPKLKDLLPCFNYWPVMNTTQKSNFLSFADGGTIEDIGIVALLQRNVQKIVVFISASESFLTYLDNPKKQAQSGTKGMVDPDSISLDIRQLFGKGNYSWFGKEWDFQVFDGNKFNSLVEGFQEKLNAGETVMYRDTYTVQPNSFFGLKGGNEVEVLWVYNNQVANWENSLNNEVKSLIEFPFPNYHTFFPPDGGSKKLVAEFFDTAGALVDETLETAWDDFVSWLNGTKAKQMNYDWVKVSIIKMNAPETSLLSHLSYWNVVNDNSAKEFRYMLGSD
jgi:hypothetical protein